MKVVSILLTVLLFSFAAAPTGTVADPADLVLTNGNVYTVNDKQPRAQAIAIKSTMKRTRLRAKESSTSNSRP